MASKEAFRLTEYGFATVDEAAKYLHIEKSKLYELLDTRALPYMRPARKRLIPWVAIKEYSATLLDEVNDFSHS